MTIHLQKLWTVVASAKNAAYDQRFIITGADEGNGTYKYGDDPVEVSGDYWSIRIQNKPPSKPWDDSDDQITFPIRSGNQVSFDIQSNDSGPDTDFNDLIVTCTATIPPESDSDFILYGSVRCYTGRCLLNPCYGPYVVIETPDAFRQAAQNPLLRKAIEELYPEKLKQYERAPHPFPDPDPGPLAFTPVMLPLHEQTAIPLQLRQNARLPLGAATPKALTDQAASGVFEIANQAGRAVAYDRPALAGLADKLRWYCDIDNLPGFVLRFSEYDRSTAELSGGPYLGEGSFEQLGMAVTDRNGNYIFRFSRSAEDFGNEILEDTAPSEDPYVQLMPDVVAELLDSTAPEGVAHRTAPYWNIPSPLKRINICIPCSKVRRPVTECTGSYRFESVGRIRIGIPANTLDSQGRITATDSSENIPQARCAAWERTLDLNGCLGHHDTVAYYTIRYRRYLSDTGWTGWEFYQERFKLFNTAVMNTILIGAFDRNLELVSGSGVKEWVKAYNNVQGNYDWATSEWALRASVNTTKAPFGGHIGPVEFRIQGYDSDGLQVTDPRIDTIRLYIDNTAPDFEIDSVMVGDQDQSDTPCGVFTLAGEPDPAVLTARFKVIQEQGFLNSYKFFVRKGNLPEFHITTTTGPGGEASAALGNDYVHVSGTSCSSSRLVGTRPPDEMAVDGDYAIAYIIPTSGDKWLETDQSVCAFAVKLHCDKRATNGYNTPVRNYGTTEKLFVIKQS